jgi:twitching motility protein PilT
MGRDQGMQVLDSALLEAINNKEVDPDDAIRFATDKKKFQRFVTNTDLVPIIDIGDQSKV